MTATQCLQHAWLRRRQPLQRPKVERLESTRDNLRSCVDRWGDQSPTPFIVQTPRTFKEIDNNEPQLLELVKPFNGQLPVAVKEVKNGEIRSTDSKPSVVIPADVHMKENTLSPTSPHSPLPKKIKLQEDTEETKSGKKSDSKSKSSTKKSKSPTNSSLNTNNKPSDSVNSINFQAPTTQPEAKEPKSNGISKITPGSSISVQPPRTQPEVKESKLNGISKVTSESSISVQAPKTQPEVKELRLNGISKATSESSVAVQALKTQSEAKEPKFNGISKVTSESSISVQGPKPQPEVKEPKLNGTYRVTSEISINVQAPKTEPDMNSIPKVTSGSNISVQAPKTQPEVGESQLKDRAKSENKAPSVQNLGQLGKSPVSQTKSSESQNCRQEKMECASVTTNSNNKVNDKLGESRPIETSNKIDLSRASAPGSEAGISELSMKVPTSRDHDQKESPKFSLILPVSPKPGPIKSDDLINRTPSSFPNTAQKPPPSPPITVPNKTNACGVNNVDLSSKVQPVVTVPTTETKTSPNPPSPQIPKPTTPEPSRVNIIPIRLEENTQNKTVPKQEPPQVEEKPKKPPKQLGNNISGLKSIWGSKISANEPKHHPIIKYNRTLSSPVPNTAKSRLIIGPKPLRLLESEKEQLPPTATSGPKVILHRINVDEANKTASNQASTESRVNDSIKKDSSKNSSNKSPINEWVNERLLNDRFNFDRRASDISNLVNSDSFYEDNPDGVGIRLAEEISRITDKFCRLNDDDKVRSGDKSALIAQERNDKITDLLNGKRRPKYRRITYLSRDVPLGSAPPPTNLAYYLTNCLTMNAASPLWAGTGCDFFSAPGTPVGSPRSPSEGSLDTDIIFQMLSKKLNADRNLQNATQKKTGLINT